MMSFIFSCKPRRS